MRTGLLPISLANDTTSSPNLEIAVEQQRETTQNLYVLATTGLRRLMRLTSDFGDVLGLQSDVARATAQEILTTLTPQEQVLFEHSKRVGKPGGENASRVTEGFIKTDACGSSSVAWTSRTPWGRVPHSERRDAK